MAELRTILRSREDAQRLTAQRYGYVRDMQAARDPDSEPAIDALVRDYMGGTPPVAPQPGDVVVPAGALPAQAPVVVAPEVKSSTSVVRPVAIEPGGKRK